jgi:hypothetical protein
VGQFVKPVSTLPVAAINADDVRAQLKRLLAHPVFKGSRRCPHLLEYLVEYALRGETDHPKERTLGIEVFGRQADYDKGDDPVVRGAVTNASRSGKPPLRQSLSLVRPSSTAFSTARLSAGFGEALRQSGSRNFWSGTFESRMDSSSAVTAAAVPIA